MDLHQPSLRVFISYAHRDENFRRELDDHLKQLQREGKLALWIDRMISPGQEFVKQINQALESADVILLLVSAHFLSSDYCSRPAGR